MKAKELVMGFAQGCAKRHQGKPPAVLIHAGIVFGMALALSDRGVARAVVDGTSIEGIAFQADQIAARWHEELGV